MNKFSFSSSPAWTIGEKYPGSNIFAYIEKGNGRDG
jgi:hypothetical protein